MNHLFEILNEVKSLSHKDVIPYFEKNASAHIGIYQLCKNCKHPLVSHTIKSEKVELSSCRNYERENIPCLCKEFVPSDNLGYIEYLAAKRGLVL